MTELWTLEKNAKDIQVGPCGSARPAKEARGDA